MKKLTILLALLASCSISNFDSSSLSATNLCVAASTIDLRGWECVGGVVLYEDNGNGYVFKRSDMDAKLFVKNIQGYIAAKVVVYGWSDNPVSEYSVSRLSPAWRPNGPCSGETAPTSFNARAGVYYFNL